jgi:hypothetical protein
MKKTFCDRCKKEAKDVKTIRIFQMGGGLYSSVDMADVDLCDSCIDALGLKHSAPKPQKTPLEKITELLAIIIGEEVEYQVQEESRD